MTDFYPEMAFNRDAKKLILAVLRNATRLVASGYLNNCHGLGIVAAHLRDICDYIGNEFEEGYDGDTSWENLCEAIQDVGFEVNWHRIVSGHLKVEKPEPEMPQSDTEHLVLYGCA